MKIISDNRKTLSNIHKNFLYSSEISKSVSRKMEVYQRMANYILCIIIRLLLFQDINCLHLYFLCKDDKYRQSLTSGFI